jgi:hypothetical protein
MGVKYRCEFSDIANLAWKWDFEVEGWGGSITAMQAAGDPMTYDCLAGSDDLYEDPVRGTIATLRVIATSLGQWDVFSTVNPLEVRVKIYQGGNLYFVGWIQPGSLDEAYDDYPYAVTITATDGLGYLKEIEYVPSTEGRRSEDDLIITDMLSEIGATSFNEIVNIYEENMASDTDDSAIEQTYPLTDAFEDMTCYEVLEEILKSWKALIRQKDGIFWIYRPKEMTGNAYARKFTAVGTKTAETVNYIQQISRSTTPSGFRDTNGGVKRHLTTAKKLTLLHDLGNRESWVKNWEFNAETFDGTNFEDWTGSTKHISEYVSDEEQGVIITGAIPVSQSIAPNIKASIGDLLTIELEYGFYNPTNAALPFVGWQMQVRQGSFYLKDVSDSQSTMDWQTDPYTIEIRAADLAPGWSGWTTWKRQTVLAGFDIDGPIQISLWPGTFGAIAFNCTKNLRLFVSSYDLLAKPSSYAGRERFSNLAKTRKYYTKAIKEIKEKRYEITGATYGEIYDEDHILGDIEQADASIDNILEQFKGSLGRAEILDPHEFKLCFIRNQEMDNTLAIASSTMLTITAKDGQVITVDNLPDYSNFDLNGWAAMLIDEDKTNTTDPTATGDYLFKNFVTIDRTAKTLTFPSGYSLTAWGIGDNLALYNPFLNYSFVGDQTQGPIISLDSAPAWREVYSINGGMFRHSDGRFIWLFAGYDGSGYSIGYIHTTDFVTWTYGNSDMPIVTPGDFADCNSVHQPGSIHEEEGNPGHYWCIVMPRTISTGKNETRIMYFDEDFSSITFSANPILSSTPYYGNAGGGIVKIGDYYHIGYLYTNQLAPDRELRVAKSLNLEGPYTDYQTILAGTSGANDGMPWSNNVDNFGLFYDGQKYYGLFGATAKWSESGNKGNRQYCLLDYDEDLGQWFINEKSPVIINPLYYQDINSTYLWCGDHCGGYFAMFVEGTDVYLSLTMKGSVYQAALFQFNNIGNIFATGKWARRGVSESKNLLQIVGEELALQKSTQRQMLSGYPIIDRDTTDNAAHLNVLGVFTDDLNKVSGVARKFAFHRGSYNVKMRQWMTELIEIKE